MYMGIKMKEKSVIVYLLVFQSIMENLFGLRIFV